MMVEGARVVTALSIRLLSESELDVCAEMMASSPPWRDLAFTEEQCRRNLSTPPLQVFVAVSAAGELVAFLASLEMGFGGEPLLEYLCVREDLRGLGIGTQLVNYFERKVHPRAANVYLFVSDINPRARALYERLGYKRVGELSDYNLKGQTEFIYRKHREPRQARQRLR